MQTNQGITSYKQFKIITWSIIAINFGYFALAYFISKNIPEKNIPEFIKNNTELIFWLVFLSALILTLILRQIIEKLTNKIPAVNAKQYYSREIVKLIFLENISIIGLVFVILIDFKLIYSLFFLTPIALILKFFPSEYQEK